MNDTHTRQILVPLVLVVLAVAAVIAVAIAATRAGVEWHGVIL